MKKKLIICLSLCHHVYSSLNKCDYYYCDDVDYAYEGLAKMGNNDPSGRDINLWFINHIKEDFPLFSNIIHIHGYNSINE